MTKNQLRNIIKEVVINEQRGKTTTISKYLMKQSNIEALDAINIYLRKMKKDVEEDNQADDVEVRRVPGIIKSLNIIARQLETDFEIQHSYTPYHPGH